MQSLFQDGYKLVTTGHNGSQRVTNLHQARTQAKFGGRNKSEIRTGLSAGACNKKHEPAPVPSASASCRSQTETNLCQAPMRSSLGSHSGSQTCARLQRQRILEITTAALLAVSETRGTSYTNLHQSLAPAHLVGHKRRQTCARPQ